MSEISTEEAKLALSRQPEVSVKISAKYLGTTERTIINYLKSKQLRGKKVGRDWFVETSTVLEMRPLGSPLQEAVLPPLENPRSANQEGRAGGGDKEWEFVKAPKRSPLKLNAFVHLREAFDVMKEHEGFSEAGHEFFRQALFEVGDDLSAGYYSFGPIKSKLYGRARIRAGRVVSRALLKKAPPGFTMILCQLVESVAYLCRSLERRPGASVTRARANSKKENTAEKSHGAD